MKYLYQQLVAFGILILLILLVLGVSFTQFTRRSMEDNNYQQLFGYARSIEKTTKRLSTQVNDNMDSDSAFKASIYLTEGFLSQQEVNFVFFNQHKTIEYPTPASDQQYGGQTEAINKHLITADQWALLKKGQQQKITGPLNIYGAKQATSYAMVPLFLEGTNFYGVLVVSQPAVNVETSVNSVTSDLLKGFIIALFVAILVSYFLATRQVRRINRMRSATKEIANGNFDVTIANKNRDELDDLANDFNMMADSLKDSNEEIERLEERRRQFMADAAHEMRTPLTTINGLLEGLQYNAIPEDQKGKAIKLMQNETSRLIRLVNENLDYEKIRTGQIVVEMMTFNATEALKDLTTQLKGKAEAAGDQLILATTEPVMVYADYDRFIQVMVNITQNAIQFTTDGTIRITAHETSTSTVIEISDTGIGMTKEQAQNIWDRYYKVDPSRKNTKYGESGLGLAIVQEIVRLHKGTINVASELGQGTTFIITFPKQATAAND